MWCQYIVFWYSAPHICHRLCFKITLYYFIWIYHTQQWEFMYLLPSCVRTRTHARARTHTHTHTHTENNVRAESVATVATTGVTLYAYCNKWLKPSSCKILHNCHCNTHSHCNSVHTSVWAHHNIMSSKPRGDHHLHSFMGSNQSLSKFCVHSEMCFYVKLYNISATDSILLHQLYISTAETAYICTSPRFSFVNTRGILNNNSAQQNTILAPRLRQGLRNEWLREFEIAT